MATNSNPRVKYQTPQKLLADDNLSDEAKIRLLKEWAVDEQLKSIAEEENMLREDGNINQLSEVLKALLSLGVEFDPHVMGPTN